eukprot:364186-Chlamydomonas_euryale.AAC.2
MQTVCSARVAAPAAARPPPPHPKPLLRLLFPLLAGARAAAPAAAEPVCGDRLLAARHRRRRPGNCRGVPGAGAVRGPYGRAGRPAQGVDRAVWIWGRRSRASIGPCTIRWTMHPSRYVCSNVLVCTS